MTSPSMDGGLASEDILSSEEELRYNRQIVLRHFDFDGQEALKQANVLIIGAGGLGCASSQYLASAGMGKMTLVISIILSYPTYSVNYYIVIVVLVSLSLFQPSMN